MDYCIYHSKDLDGLTSGAVIHAHQKEFGEVVNLIGYDYGEFLDTRKFKGKVTVMADVSMEMDRMEMLGKASLEFIWIDHHVSAFEEFKKYCEEKGYSIIEVALNGLIKQFSVKEMNIIYYYSDRLSACEICASLFAKKLGKNAKDLIAMLGQYDTWRNTAEKQFIKDVDWESVVLPIQWSMRLCEKPEDVYKILIEIDEWSNNVTYDSIKQIGKSILQYQKNQNKIIMNANSFEFTLNNQELPLRVLAVNAVGFGSIAFEGFYFPEIHDVMMSFYYDGRKEKWTFSLRTDKDDVDILSIARSFKGGGHEKACGFSLNSDEFRFLKNRIEFGSLITLDITALPKEFDFTPGAIKILIKQIQEMPFSIETKSETITKKK